MKVLVTGATGFLGRAIVCELLQNNLEVFTTARSPQADDLPNYFPADVSDVESLYKLENLGEIDAIIHSAGLAHQFKVTPKEKFWQTNIGGTKNVANLAARLKVKKFIHISSVLVYGDAKKTSSARFEEDLPCQPQGFYAQSKLEAEKAAEEICSNNSIDLTILRPAVIVGEDSKGNLTRLIRLIDRGLFIWLGSGENLKSVVYKADVARACLHFLENSGDAKNNKTNIYNVTAEPVTMREIVAEIEKTLDRRVFPKHFPASPVRKSLSLLAQASRIKKVEKIAQVLDKWLMDDVFSGEKARAEIGFQVAVSPLEGIRREAMHYLKQK